MKRTFIRPWFRESFLEQHWMFSKRNPSPKKGSRKALKRFRLRKGTKKKKDKKEEEQVSEGAPPEEDPLFGELGGGAL